LSNVITTSDPDSPQQPKHRSSWLKPVAWIAASLFALLLILALTTTILLHNERFHNYILKTVEKRASDSLGVQVQLQNFTVHLSNLSLDLYGLTVHGSAPYVDPPLLRVQHVLVGVRIISIFQRTWYLDNFRVDRPVLWVFTDAHGISNIPTFKSSGNSSNTSVFDLGVRHAMLNQGEVYYNDRKSVLAADLHDVEFRAAFDASLKKYSGKLKYADGHLTSGSFQPISHNLDAEFDATPDIFHLTKGVLSVGPSQLLLTATLQDYSHPSVAAQYDATLDGGQFRKLLASPFVPAGTIRATGSLNYKQIVNRTLLDSLVVSGDLNSRQLNMQAASVRAQINNIVAHYSLENGNATLKDFRANLLGGELTANGSMNSVDGDSRSKLNAGLRGISLADLRRTFGRNAVPSKIGLTGTLNGKADAAWGKSFNDLVAHTDAMIQGRVAGPKKSNGETDSAAVMPIDSAIHGTYTAASQQLALIQSYVRTPQTTLTMNGIVSTKSTLGLRLEANDLREFETMADLFRVPSPGKPLTPLGLAGTALFVGSVEGSTSAPHLTGQLTASDVHVEGSTWRVLHTSVEVSPSLVSLQHGDLEPASHGHITFGVSAGLDKWSFTNTSPLHIELESSQLDVADLEKLAGQQVPITGTLAANIKMHGTELNPVGQGSISLTHVTAYDEPIQTVKLTLAGAGDEVHGDLGVQLPAGSLESKVSVHPHDKSYTAELTANGIHLDQLAILKTRNVIAKGILNLNATGHGTFDNPQGEVRLQIPRLDIQNQVVTDLDLKMNVADHIATANLVSSAVNTSIRANAKVNLTGDYLTDATVDTQAIPLQPLLAVYAPAQAADISGQTELHATLHGPLKNKSLLEAHLTIPTLKLAYSNTIQLAETAPIHVDYKNNLVTLQRGAIQGTGTDLQFQGSIPTVPGTTPMSLLLLGTVDLKLAQLFQPDIRSSGQLKFNINSSGAANSQDIGGQINIVDANFASGDLPVGLQHANGVLTLTKDRLNITKFEGTMGSGTLTAQGGIAYRPDVQFDLGLSAKGVRVLYPQGMRENVNADLRLAGTTENAMVSGSVNLSDLSFTPAFDLSNFIDQFSGGVAAPPTRGFSQNLQLNVAVRSASDINLVSRTLSINGSANLQLRGTAAQPVILGRVNLNNGDVILNGTRFLLAGGTIEFVNPSQTEPVVNLAVNTSIQQYSINLRFNGPIEQMRTNYSSDPSLPAADIINLLAFGKTTEADANNPATPANQAAESAIASQVSSQVTSRVSKIAGISQLSINPVLASGSNQGLGANITIQQRVTGNLFVTFSSNVGSTQSQTISGQYQISPRVGVSATRDQNGGFGFDTQIKKSW
jgi:translocation and assembly module TamB